MHIVDQLCMFYRNFGEASLASIPDIYSQDVIFSDPVHKVQGIGALSGYFEHLCAPNTTYRFDIQSKIIEANKSQAFIRWEMHYQHPKLAGNRPLALKGGSYLEFTDKVFSQEDYYDLGAMIYEHVPVLGWAVKSLKRRLEP